MVNDLFTRLKTLNITLKVVNDTLDIKAPKGVLNEVLLNEIKTNKESLISLINQYSESKITDYKQIPAAKKSNDYPLSSSII